MSSLSQKILDKIHKEDIKPKPRWYFILLHAILWFFFLTTILLGGISVAVVLRHFFETDWEIVHRVMPGRVGGLLFMLPYLWFLFIGLLIFFAHKLFIYTKKGYRFKPFWVVITSIILSIFLGTAFYSLRIDAPFEKGLMHHFPPYVQWSQFKERNFVAPAHGVLVGHVAKIESDKIIILVDFKNGLWTVDVGVAKREPDLKILLNERLVFLGEQVDVFTFKADEIRTFFKKVK